jgi:hypothetical protein
MYKTERSFHTPENQLTIWRYIDLTKFVDLLLTNQQFFNRSDKFQDPFEGRLKLKDYEQNKHMFTLDEETKKFYFLNCWHINELQSDAMWKIYLEGENGIAIKSNVGKLIDSFQKSDDDIFIGKVYYRDFENVTFNDLMMEQQNSLFNGRGSSLNSFNYKRKSFEHENELRVFYVDMPIPHVIKGGIPREPLNFKRIDVDLNILVDEIVISPFADSWFKPLVENLISKLGYQFNVTQSSLYEF